ncbi:MAG: hypothetical protein HeimC2_40370 [Candidatus Heimdallarchaeota archaeon LC_2]|nr:MAG: hypothetical protein HeimC2_40370 [Candidatus Heimdallarchaeota archaeon LC_2]
MKQYLTHLTKDSMDGSGNSALDNLESILNDQTIYAKNQHGWFMYNMDKFSNFLKRKFKTVSLTGLEIDQLSNFIDSKKSHEPKYQIKSCGLVFEKSILEEKGVRKVQHVKENTWEEVVTKKKFHKIFSANSTFRKLLQNRQIKTVKKANKIINKFSCIDKIGSNYNWVDEEEYRINKDLEFSFSELSAIIVEDPSSFKLILKRSKRKKQMKLFRHNTRILLLVKSKRRKIKDEIKAINILINIPIISPYWSRKRILKGLESK